MRKAQAGFTLVEILIVVAIIALLAGIAIPNLMRVRVHANDTAAVAVLRAMSSASEMYSSTIGQGNYPGNMTSLVGASPPFISTDYCGSREQGFDIACTNTLGGYTYVASPVTLGATGTTTYTMTTSGVLTP